MMFPIILLNALKLNFFNSYFIMSQTSCTTVLELASSHTNSSSIYTPCVLFLSLQIPLVVPRRPLPPNHHRGKQSSHLITQAQDPS